MEKDLDKIISQIKQSSDFFEKAKLIQHLQKDKELPLKDIAEKLGFNPSYVCHILRLNKLPDIVIDGYYTKTISVSHLFIISRLKDNKKMIDTYEEVLKKNLTVVQTEELIREKIYEIKSEGKYLNKDKINLVNRQIIGENKDIRVKITQSRIKSKIIIEIHGNLSHSSSILNKILQKLQFWRERVK